MPLSAHGSARVGSAAARPLSARQSALNPGLLLLADSRLPAGGHAHSGGLEAAAAAGSVTGLDGLAGFLRGRLATAGLVSAGLAAAACQHATQVAGGETPRWPQLLTEAAARTPSPAQRSAWCAQGRALLRAARAAWPGPALDSLARAVHLPGSAGSYHPAVLGACASAAGGQPADAAVIAATASVTGPASAAVRLLGLDPLAVHSLLAGLAEAIAAVALSAAEAAAAGDWAALPAASSPGLDRLAELHAREEVALFAS
jgi:urease accessory protein